LYSFFVPLAALAWKRVQKFEPIILLVHDVPATRLWGTDRQTAIILHWLKEWGFKDNIYYLHYNQSLPDNNVAVSQVARLFVAGMCGLRGPIQEAIERDAFILTTDVDIMPVAPAEYWLPTHEAYMGKITNSHCCGYQTVNGETFREYPMSTLAFRASTWRAIMQYDCICTSTADCQNGSMLQSLNKVLQELFHYGTPRQTPTQWNMDQRLVSYQLHNSHEVLKTEMEQKRTGDRADRGAWPTGALLDNITAKYTDSHMLRPGYTVDNWAELGKFLKVAMQVNVSSQQDVSFWHQVELYVEQYRAAVGSGSAQYTLIDEGKKGR
jgi:hypothetical protein